MLLRATGGKSYYFSNISINNSTGKILYYIYTRRYTLYDVDGSLSGAIFDGATRSSATITPYYAHNEIPGLCSNATNQTAWDDSLICNAGVVVNNLDFSAAQPTSMFKGVRMWVKRLDSDTQVIDPSDTVKGDTWVYKTDAE